MLHSSNVYAKDNTKLRRGIPSGKSNCSFSIARKTFFFFLLASKGSHTGEVVEILSLSEPHPKRAECALWENTRGRRRHFAPHEKAFYVQSTNNESRLSPVLEMEFTRWELVGGLLQAFAWFELLEINFRLARLDQKLGVDLIRFFERVGNRILA